MTQPYYADEHVTLYLDDCREILPTLDVTPDACVTDPPYGTTTATWDHWQDGWVRAVGDVLPPSASLWSFGTAAMFLNHAHEFAGWKFAQEQLWLKHSGSGPADRSRLVPVHEWAYHWYRGRWTGLHHEWERDAYNGPRRATAHKTGRNTAHQSAGGPTTWTDDGTRQRKTIRVVEAKSVRFRRRHQDEKPLSCVIDLVRECTPPGGLVLDPFAGAGTTAVAARRLGRRALLIEGDEGHCEKIAARLQEVEVG